MKKVDLRISTIRELEFFLNPFDPPDINQLTYSLNYTISLDIEKKTLGFYVTVLYHPVDQKENVFAKIKVYNEFLILNMDELPRNEKNQVGISAHILKALLAVAIPHTRALFAVKLLGTQYEKFILPLIDPEILVELIIDSKEVEHKNGEVFINAR